MKNVYGNALTLTLFGESHGSSIGAVLDGLSPGIPVDEAHIARELTRRRPQGQTATARVEQDPFVIESGVFNGCTTGTPLCIRIPNAGQHSGDYAGMQDCARPGHSDYPAFCKYHGYSDYRGGGHFSGRITAALVAAGAIAEGALRGRGIRIGTHLAACAGVQDRPFRQTDGQIPDGELDALREPGFPVLDRAAGERMQQAILAAKADGDSVGGVTETAVTGLCAGLGEPWFDTVESLLSHALFSVPAVKGVEFGDGFALADMRGSESNDAYRVDESGRIITETNSNGGIGGGITNGQPIVFRCAVKPTPSIVKKQDTVDFVNVCNTEIAIKGRHDPCIVHRARAVVDAVTALTLADMLSLRYGTDWLAR